MAVDEIDPVQREINKIKLYNLKVDIADTMRGINVLQKAEKQWEINHLDKIRRDREYEHITGHISFGKDHKKRISEQISFIT